MSKILLITPRKGAGLWSSVFQVIGMLRYAEENDLFPLVYFNSHCCWWSNDGFKGDRNAWEYLFCPVGYFHSDDLPEIKNGALDHASAEEMQLAMPGLIVRKDYILPHVDCFDHTEEQRQEYASIKRTRIVPKGRILAMPVLSMISSTHTTAIHYRGTDKVKESPRQSVEDYQRAIDATVDPSQLLFVATDSQAFLNFMIQTYGDRVIHSNANLSHDSTPLHKGPHAGPKQAEECLIDVLLMAKCSHLIHGNSNVSNGVLCFNPTMTHTALHLL